eukprot:GHUV01046357.1.p1 GENE.GHUV01046357.1~~GHUV01046357.1.p1  ORF type:complete len:128 (-),score=34.70 GHUV01046357.1:256-639(-)
MHHYLSTELLAAVLTSTVRPAIAVRLMQVVFVGVFLLTKASAPKGQGSNDGYLTAELNNARIAYVHHVDDETAQQHPADAETTGLIGTQVADEAGQIEQLPEGQRRIGAAAGRLQARQAAVLRLIPC